MASQSVVVVGSINLDLIYTCQRIPRPGETLHASGSSTSPGGKGANQAVAAARRGARVAMVGAVGTDGFAGDAVSLLAEAGVDLRSVASIDGPTGIAVIYVQEDGENSILVNAGANSAMTRERVESHAELIQAAPIVALQGEIPRAGIEAAAALCGARPDGGRLVLNLAPVMELDPAVIRQADPLVVNEYEGRLALTMLTGQEVADDTAAVKALLQTGVRSVVLTRGAAGALVGDASGVVSVPSPKVKVVDTTGAGDAFVGALLAGLATGASLREAAVGAVRVGAFACTKPGAQASYPALTEDLPEIT